MQCTPFATETGETSDFIAIKNADRCNSNRKRGTYS